MINDKEREGEFAFLVGTQNTGKTELIRELMEGNERNLILPPSRGESAWDDVEELDWRQIWEEATGDLALDAPRIMRSDNAENVRKRYRFAYYLGCELANFKGNRKLFIDKDTAFIFEVVASEEFGFKNGGLICDDFKNYIPASNLPGFVSNLITNRRTKRLDLFFATHDFTLIARELFKYNPSFFVFRTELDLDPSDKRMSKRLFERIQSTKKEVDTISLQGINEKDPAKRCHCELVDRYEVNQAA